MFFYVSRHKESNAALSLVIKCEEIQYGSHRLGKLHPNFSPITQISSAFLTALFNYVIHQIEFKYRTINVNKELSTMKLILMYYI